MREYPYTLLLLFPLARVFLYTADCGSLRGLLIGGVPDYLACGSSNFIPGRGRLRCFGAGGLAHDLLVEITWSCLSMKINMCSVCHRRLGSMPQSLGDTHPDSLHLYLSVDRRVVEGDSFGTC